MVPTCRETGQIQILAVVRQANRRLLLGVTLGTRRMLTLDWLTHARAQSRFERGDAAAELRLCRVTDRRRARLPA